MPFIMVAPWDSMREIRERRVVCCSAEEYCQKVSQGRPKTAPLREDLEVRYWV